MVFWGWQVPSRRKRRFDVEGFKVRREGPLTLRDSEPEPDVSFVEGERDDGAEAHPSSAMLVVEVSVTSQAIDESKADIYAEAGVAEYWLVRPDDRTVELSSGGFSSPKTFRWIRMSPTFWR